MALRVVEEVWEGNLVEEMKRIRKILKSFGLVSINTEFPDTVFKPQQRLHIHHPDSVALLQRQGIDFSANKRHGIPAATFGEFTLMDLSGKANHAVSMYVVNSVSRVFRNGKMMS